jgi:hypothetical protein
MYGWQLQHVSAHTVPSSVIYGSIKYVSHSVKKISSTWPSEAAEDKTDIQMTTESTE